MSFNRKLMVGGAVVLVVAGGATGAGLAASGHSRTSPSVHALALESTTKAGFVQASAEYLGTDVATLRHEMKIRALADIANGTPGRSAKQLATLLASAAIARLEFVANRALSTAQARSLHTSLRRSITGFLNDTCPLGLAGLTQDLGGCPGKMMRLARASR